MTWQDEWRFRDCPWCGLRDADMMPLETNRDITKLDGSRTRRWTSVACPRCAGVTVIETGILNGSPTILQTVPGDVHRETHRLEQVLPDDVCEYFTSARRVLDAGVPDAAAVQLRRTLEAAAAALGQTEGVLYKRIEKLVDEGVVANTFRPVLDHVRKIGNLGAHATDEKIDAAEAERVFRFTTLFLQNAFEIPAELAAIDTETNPPAE